MKPKITPPISAQGITLSRGYCDILKFAAALLVAFGHYAGHALDYTSNVVLKIQTMTGGYSGVAIFFFLSGYGLMMSERRRHLDFLAYCRRRLSKVYAPVVIVSAIWGVVIWPEGQGFEHLPAYLYTTFISFGDGILWFVRVIAVMYLLFYGYAMLRTREYLRLPAIIFGTVAAYVLVYHWMADWSAISVPLFALGIMLAEYNEACTAVVRRWPLLLLWFVVTTVVMAALYYYQGNLYAHVLLNIYIVSLIIICAPWVPELTLPVWLGGISYDIYLTHNKVLKFLAPVYGYIPTHHFIVGTVITATASYALRNLKLLCK